MFWQSISIVWGCALWESSINIVAVLSGALLLHCVRLLTETDCGLRKHMSNKKMRLKLHLMF